MDTENPHDLLAARSGVSLRRIYAILNREQGGVEFDTADKLLCALGNPHKLWRSDGLRFFYYHADLSTHNHPGKVAEKRCELPGCSNTFVPSTPWGKFCSSACKMKNYRENRRKREGRPRRYGTRYDKCPRGHDRSPENTYVRSDGGQQCRVCRRDDLREKSHQDEEYRLAMRDKERRRRAENREAINARRREIYHAKRKVAA